MSGMEAGGHGGNMEEEEDDVCVDASFFLNEKYGQLLLVFPFDQILVTSPNLATDFKSSRLAQKRLSCTASSHHLLVWPGAELLAEYLFQNQGLLEGSSVLELGAGLGLTGLLCARYCEHVVITDYHDTVLKVLQMNVDHQICASALPSLNVEVQKLDWGCGDHLDSILKKHDKGFDLIIGADIFYQESFVPPLMITISRLLKQERARSSATLAYVSRIKSMDVAVIREASKLNLEVIEVPGTRKTVAGGFFGGWIYEISLKPAY